MLFEVGAAKPEALTCIFILHQILPFSHVEPLDLKDQKVQVIQGCFIDIVQWWLGPSGECWVVVASVVVSKDGQDEEVKTFCAPTGTMSMVMFLTSALFSTRPRF
jgi:hypothetical protein